MDFEGQVALVIGGASGMGLATARILAERGAQIIIADRDEAGARREAAALVDLGLAVVARGLDARSPADRAALFTFVDSSYGGLNVLFNTLGSHGPDGLEIDESSYDETFDMNVKVHYFTTVEALPLLRARAPKASVSLMSSAGGLRYSGRSPLYAITKSAVVMMAQTMARDLGPAGIRVNVICPGPVDTPFGGSNHDPQTREVMKRAFLQKLPLRRIASADDIGELVAFLASDAGSYLTGLTLPVEGGGLLM